VASGRDLCIAVAGPGDASEAELAVAEEVGAGLAAAGAILVTGGLGGVMEAASRGARSRLGVTVGLLPGDDAGEANGWVQVALPTGLGELRNGLIVRCCGALVAIGGGYGTLSEIALALKAGKPVIGVDTWTLGRDPDPIMRSGDPDEAAAMALAAVR
jgi:uncharacterized protein (TIGR00725 family)